MAFSRPHLGLFAAMSALLALAACGRDSAEITRVGVIGAEPRLVETVTAPLTEGEALFRSNVAQGLVRFDERGQRPLFGPVRSAHGLPAAHGRTVARSGRTRLPGSSAASCGPPAKTRSRTHLERWMR